MEAQAREVQALHTESNGKLGLIENFVNKKIPADWDSWSIDRRLLFWSGGFDDGMELIERTKVCSLEIWEELFRGDVKAYTPAVAREITGLLKSLDGWKYSTSVNLGAPYGKQRAFIRKETEA